MQVESFPPLLGEEPRVLVLGSTPSVASIEAGEYYGHPRNAFWPLMAELFGFDAQAPYAARVQALTGSGVAVWDVLQSCVREGSLDASIDRASDQDLSIVLDGGKSTIVNVVVEARGRPAPV